MARGDGQKRECHGGPAEMRAYITARVNIVNMGYDTPCWIWALGVKEKGYGACFWNRVHTHAHRVAYRGFVGEIPGGLQIDHLCRVKRCCNPDHLEAVTNQVNSARAAKFHPNVTRTHCKRGHQRVPENLLHGSGDCRLCRNIRQREWQKRKAA